jgi:hypothetical protein
MALRQSDGRLPSAPESSDRGAFDPSVEPPTKPTPN